MRAVQHTSAPPHLPSDAAARREEQCRYCCLRSGSHRGGQPPSWSGRPLSPTIECAQRTLRCRPATEPPSANLLVVCLHPNEHADERDIQHVWVSMFVHPCDGVGFTRRDRFFGIADRAATPPAHWRCHLAHQTVQVDYRSAHFVGASRQDAAAATLSKYLLPSDNFWLRVKARKKRKKSPAWPPE